MVLHNMYKGYSHFNGTEEDDELLEIIAEFQETDPLIPLNVLIDQNKIFTHLNLMKI